MSDISLRIEIVGCGFLSRVAVEPGHSDLPIVVGGEAEVDRIVADHRVGFDAIINSQTIL